MKGTITRCLVDFVESRFGAEKWAEIATHAGVTDTSTLRMPVADVDDGEAARLLSSTATVLGLSDQEAADAFGEYWCCTYAPKMYGSLVRNFPDARSMILGMDALHVKMTASIPNARPPRFDFHEVNDREVEVTYRSHRNLLHVYIGLARGVGKLFDTPLDVQPIGKDKVRIRFPEAGA